MSRRSTKQRRAARDRVHLCACARAKKPMVWRLVRFAGARMAARRIVVGLSTFIYAVTDDGTDVTFREDGGVVVTSSTATSEEIDRAVLGAMVRGDRVLRLVFD